MPKHQATSQTPFTYSPSSARKEHALQRRDEVHRTEHGFGESPCQTTLGMKAFHIFERRADCPEPIVDHLPFVLASAWIRFSAPRSAATRARRSAAASRKAV